MNSPSGLTCYVAYTKGRGSCPNDTKGWAKECVSKYSVGSSLGKHKWRDHPRDISEFHKGPTSPLALFFEARFVCLG